MEQAHGHHWKCVTNPDRLFEKNIPELFQKGTIIDMTLAKGKFFDNDFITSEGVFSFAYPDKELSPLVIIAKDRRKKETNVLVTAFPFIKTGAPITLKIEKILEWDHYLEALMQCTTEDDQKITFFDTKYFVNKDQYETGKTYNFLIAGLAYHVEFPEKDTISFEGEAALQWYRELGREIEYDKNGEVKPLEINKEELVALLPKDDKYPDSYEFQSPVMSITDSENMFDHEFYKLEIIIFRDPDFTIPLFVQKEKFNNKKPEINKAIMGNVWIQGYLDSKEE